MSLKDALELMAHSTVSQLLARADFNERYKSGKDISFLEFMYPLLQAYDSVKLEADVELGGTDQKFNLLMGRELQRDFGQDPQVVLTMPLLIGLDGVNKMSKSYGNHIGIDEKPEEMFGKIMSISDELMLQYYELLTDENLDEIKKMHPMDAKKRLAKEIVRQYHGSEASEIAKRDFENKFQKKDPFKELKLELKKFRYDNLCDFLIAEKICPSRSEYRRLVMQGAIEVNSYKINELDYRLEPSKEYCIKIGKKRFLKVKFL